MSDVPHYNAFISYRHHPQDIAVAEAIHKGLERFKVPRSLKKQGKKIERIFRDKEELPITSSLTDTITTALRNSDFQIVICSTHLKDSYWVQREIETFLQTHTKDQVLTVIVDGEPNEVIPEILTYREITDPQTGETIRDPLEPLSCDWRLGKRKAMKVELPRLAAVLLGCTYNDLIQRQKQYRMRQLAIGAGVGMAASLALAGYFLYTSIQIQENLNQSLRNQSQYLASTADTLFDNGDRLTAITLALEALPTEESPRPYVVAAEEALADALMLYNPESDIIAVGAYTADALINEFLLSDEGEYLYVLDSRNEVSVWDTDAFSKISNFAISAQSLSSKLLTDLRGNLVVVDVYGEKHLSSYAPDGSLRWVLEEISDAAFYKDKSVLLATTHREDGNYLLTLDPDTSEEIADRIYICSADEATFVHLDSDSYYPEHPLPVTLYSGGDSVALLDTSTGKLTRLLTTDNYIFKQNVTPDGRILLDISNDTDSMNGYILDATIVSTTYDTVYCYNAAGKLLWTRELADHMYSDLYTLEAVPDSDHVFAQTGNNFSLLDGATGQVLAQCFSTAPPLLVDVYDDSAWAFFSDGGMGTFSFDKQTISTIQYMESGVADAAMCRGLYVSRSLNTSITRYRTVADDSYTTIDGNLGSYVRQTICTDQCALLSSGALLKAYDLTNRQLLWQDDSWSIYWDLLGCSDTSLYAGYRYEGVRRYDLTTGAYTLLEYPTDADYPYASLSDSCIPVGDHLFYALYPTYDAPAQLVDWDVTAGTYTLYDCFPAELFEGTTSYSNQLSLVYADENRLLIHAEAGWFYEFTFADGRCRQIHADTGDWPVFWTDATGEVTFLAVGHTILELDADYQPVRTIQLDETTAVSLTFHEDILYALCDDGHMYRYDREGNFISVTALSLYSNFYTDVKYLSSMRVPISWAFTRENELILNADRMGNIIPEGELSARGSIPHLLCYDAASDSFICTYDTQLIAYDRLSTAQVMDRGRDVLGTYELSADQRTAYGLG